ncbi:MAG: hypothetical protein V4491_07030 [Pseudomonadota bacterium]
MDSYRDFPSDYELGSSSEATDHSADVAAAIGTDERRMHVRAYNYWVSLLEGRDFPSIEDLEPGDLNDFSGNSVLLDFTCGRDNPAIPYIGGAIRDECGLDDDTRMISDVPSRSLLSRLTDHYMQIIANRAPVGFEAEFVNQRSQNICYRGILMPFSSDGESIDFIYGVINWKKEDGEFAGSSEMLEAPLFEPQAEIERALEELNAAPLSAAELQPDSEDVVTPVGDDAGLADLLCAARATAEAVKAGEGRTRAALYQALSLAYDFALTARRNPEDFAELLADSGVKAQARAPMTPIVKLVFGVDYDKARLTEFAAALSFADRRSVAPGGFEPFIAGQQGGLKALVAAERQARRPADQAENSHEAARTSLRSAPVLSLDNVGDHGEFALIVVRRSAGGGYEPVALVADDGLTDRAIRKAG